METMIDSVIGNMTAYNIVHRADVEFDEILSTEEDWEVWFNKAVKCIALAKSMAQGFDLIFAVILAKVKQNWENIPLPIRQRYDYQFNQFALSVSDGYAWSTIENHIRAAEVYVLSGKGQDKEVEVPKLTDDGKIEEVVTKKFNPYDVGMGKLMLALSKVKHDKFDNWNDLADPTVDWDTFRRGLAQPKEEKSSSALTFSLVGPTLCVEQYGITAPLSFDFDWESYYNECPLHDLVKDGMDLLFKMLGINPNSDEIMTWLENKRTQQEKRRIR